MLLVSCARRCVYETAVDTTSNSERNDMGAYGGPEGGWKRNSR